MYKYQFTIENVESEELVKDFFNDLNEADQDNPVYGEILSIVIEENIANVEAQTKIEQVAKRMDGKIYNGIIL